MRKKIQWWVTTALMIVVTQLLPTGSAQATIEGGYKDGLYLQTDDGNYQVKTNFFLQFQHQFLNIEGQGKTNGLQIRRSRVVFSGNAFSPELTYKFELELGSGLTNNVSRAVAETGPNLRDAWINYDVKNGIEIRAGQFKVPFNLAELIPDHKQQFIDRSTVNDALGYSRDMGIDVHGRVIDKKLEYHVYVFNEGLNSNKFNNTNDMLFGGRLGYNFLGDHGYTSSDVEDSEDPQLMAGVATTVNRVNPAGAKQTLIATTGDVAFRYKGFSTIGSGYYLRNQTGKTNTYALEGQAGYFVIPKHLEVIARYSGVIPTAGGVTNGHEVGGGLNYTFYGHRLKLMMDYAILINSPLVLGNTTVVPAIAAVAGPKAIIVTGGAPAFIQNQNDHRVRTQLQVFF